MEASPEDCFRDAKIYVMFLKWLCICDYPVQFCLQGLHSGIGPPGVGTLGTAAYANVPTRPTSSSNALSERFMVDFLLRVCRRLASNCRPSASRIIHKPATF